MQEERDIGQRLRALEEFLQEQPPTKLLLHVATGLIVFAVISLIAFLLFTSISAIFVIIFEVSLVVVAGYLIVRHSLTTQRWQERILEHLKDCLLRLEFISAEVHRFITSFDDTTREHYQSLTQTKIRSYFILQEILQKITSETNTLSEAITTQDWDLLVEIGQTLLTPLTVKDSPIKGNEVVLNRQELEQFLGEISEELIMITQKTLDEVKI